MPASPPRSVVVDDADSSIIYTGPWFQAASNSLDSLGNYGPTYLGTSHGTNGAASFSFSFQGSAVNVLGTTNVSSSDPSWGCFIDGVSFKTQDPDRLATENNWALCTWSGGSGPHVLTVNVTSKGQTFWFDWLQYDPPSTAILQDAVVYVDHQDAAIKYDSSWQGLEGDYFGANMTMKQGSTATVDFIGTQLSWYGVIPSALPQEPSIATYAIDGQTVPTQFTLEGLTTANSNTFNQRFFQTPTLSSSGPHELVVTFQGSGSSTPLTVIYLLIQDGTLSVPASSTSTSSSASSKSTSSPSSSSPSSPPTSSPSSPSSSSSPSSMSSSSPSSPSALSTSSTASSHLSPGPIVGGILGGLSLFILCLLVICSCKRKRMRGPALLSSSYEGPVIAPFHIPSSPTFLLQNNSYSTASSKPDLHSSQPISHNPSSGVVTSSGGPTHVPSKAVLHQDSGIRLPGQREDTVVDMPPLYTPG